MASLARLAQFATSAQAPIYTRPHSDYALTLDLLQGRMIAIEGEPGSGKTTLVKSLKAALLAHSGGQVLAHEEDRDDLVLNEFFKDPATYGFFFQMFKLGRRHLRCEEALRETLLAERTPGQPVYHLEDRTLPGDMAFAYWNYAVGNFTDDQLTVYLKYALRITYPRPFLLVYLDVSPSNLVLRITRRGNPDEIALYTHDYFVTMKACYLTALRLSGCNYVVIDHNQEYDSVTDSSNGLLPATVCFAILEKALRETYGNNMFRLVSHQVTARINDTALNPADTSRLEQGLLSAFSAMDQSEAASV